MSKFSRFSRAGFTLLEILVAMSMIAVLAGSLYAGLNTGFRARRRAEAALAPLKEAGAVFAFMEGDLSCAPPPRGILAGEFLGEAEALSFYTRPMSTHEAAPGIVSVKYALVSPPDGSAPVLARYITVNLLSHEAEEPVEEILCSGVRTLKFSYFDGQEWLDAWDSVAMGDILPAAVEISLEIEVPSSSGPGMELHDFRYMCLIPCAAPLQEEIT